MGRAVGNFYFKCCIRVMSWPNLSVGVDAEAVEVEIEDFRVTGWG